MPVPERLLIVGLGSIGRRHARLARQLLPHAEIAALRHREVEGAAEPGIDRSVASIEQALALRPQAAIVANPASMHLTVALKLAQAGVHLLVEKPIAKDAAGVAELIATARAQGAVLMTGYNLRFLPSLRAFRTELEARRVGRVLSVRAESGQFLPSWRPGQDYRTTVSAQAALGGGVLLELSHEIDYLRWLFGDVESVSATLSRQSALEIDAEDSAHLVLRFASTGGGTPLLATLNVDFIRHDTTRNCTVVGETGTLRWNAVSGKVDVLNAGDATWTTLHEFPAIRDESYLLEWQNFLDCIATGATPVVSGADGLAVMQVIDAARQSSSAGAVARVDSTIPSPDSLSQTT